MQFNVDLVPLSARFFPYPIPSLVKLALKVSTIFQRHSVHLSLLRPLDDHCLDQNTVKVRFAHGRYLLHISPILLLPKESVLGVQQPHTILLSCGLIWRRLNQSFKQFSKKNLSSCYKLGNMSSVRYRGAGSSLMIKHVDAQDNDARHCVLLLKEEGQGEQS